MPDDLMRDGAAIEDLLAPAALAESAGRRAGAR
jgi:hypothetical protein